MSVNPNTGAVSPNLQVGFGLGSATTASISNDLQNTGRTIELIVAEGDLVGVVWKRARPDPDAPATYDAFKDLR